MNEIGNITLLASHSFVLFAKGMIIVIQIIYVLFAFMLTRQLKIMNKNFQTSMAPIFAFLATLHLLIALGILALSFLTF